MLGVLAFFLFIVMPVVEILLLIYIGNIIGFWPTVLIVLGTGILGGIMASMQGPRAWRDIGQAWREGRVPGKELVAGALFLVGAAFLLTPGIITDAVGFLLMIPWVRRGIGRLVVGRWSKRIDRASSRMRVVRIDP